MSMIFSTASASHVPTTSTHAPWRHVKEYLTMRKAQIESLVPALDVLQTEYYQRAGITSSADLARKQIALIDSVIASINSGSPDKTIIYNLKDIFGRIELRLFYEDIESLLSTGKTVLPVELAEIPAYFKRREAERQAEEARIKQEEKARLKTSAVVRIKAQQAAARQSLAQELGISEEAIFAKNRD